MKIKVTAVRNSIGLWVGDVWAEDENGQKWLLVGATVVHVISEKTAKQELLDAAWHAFETAWHEANAATYGESAR